jgi:nicotinamide-nucleotide amidase
METEIRGRLGTLIYGVDEETLEGNVVKLLEEMKLTLSTVELFTGGSVAQRLSRTESTQFIQGFVLNTEETTRSFLGIGMEELSELKGAGGEFVLCLAGKTREGCRSDVGLSVAGFSQRETPREGGEIKAHIYIGIVSEDGGKWADYELGGTKAMLRERAAIIALDTLRKELLNMGSS